MWRYITVFVLGGILGIGGADYPSVVIWCAAFGVLISPADLKFL